MAKGVIVESLNQIILKNTPGEFITALMLFVLFFFLIKSILKIILSFLKKSKSPKKSKKSKTIKSSEKESKNNKTKRGIVRRIIADIIKGIKWPFYAFISFYLTMLFLELPQRVSDGLNFLLLIFLIIIIAYGISKISSYFFEEYKEKRKEKKESSNESMIKVLNTITNFLIWTLAILMILSHLGVEVTPLIAGLGIGGVAIAFALQGILSDLFAAFVIYFDKPFEEGDFIIVGDDMGVIKRIGIKTTRLQALGGQELVISNQELTSSRINNYKKMNLRRVVFSFGVEYKTKVKQLEKIKKIVSEIITKEKDAKLDRVHFKEFADSSLVFEVVYYVNTNDYRIYMDVQEKINLKVKESLEKEGIDFAFPSHSVYMK